MGIAYFAGPIHAATMRQQMAASFTDDQRGMNMPKFIVTVVRVTRIAVEVLAPDKAAAGRSWKAGHIVALEEVEHQVLDVHEAA